jgi:pyruvate,orthophosphate dikinase
VTEERWVQFFEEGRGDQKELLGGKGAALAEMTRLGLPVPPGFTITTRACNAYLTREQTFPNDMEEQIFEALEQLEATMGRSLGAPANPLLVSVRSGAAVSMPGMMDTILNLGLNDETVEGLAAATDRRFAYDCYRRFIQMYANVVLKLDINVFEERLAAAKRRYGAEYDVELTADALQRLVEEYKQLVADNTGGVFPQDPEKQLLAAVRAVFESWNNERAKVYRRLHKLPDDLGTAVNVQAMVFGNMGRDSGTGVVFSRSPSTGEAELYGEYLLNAQGEDVVAGIRTPRPISELIDELPEAHAELGEICRTLEEHYRDMQDIEFTIQEGKLYVLQTRTGKRTARAALRIAFDMVQEGLIDRDEALLRIEPDRLEKLLHRNIDPEAKLTALCGGLPASPGAAAGRVVFSSDEAEKLAQEGKKVILVRPETTPDDIHGIVEAQGVLTSRGGMTCHAAIVARGMGKPCVVGCEELEIDLGAQEFHVKGGPAADRDTRGRTGVVQAGDRISIDGTTGEVYLGEVPTIEPELSDEFRSVLSWADEIRELGVWANADTPEDAEKARSFGAQGIGLCRTEHMFMEPDRLPVVRQMILASNEQERLDALDRLLPMQQEDFEGILAAMEGLPVTIRLLDPPLHEFLPDMEKLLVEQTGLELGKRIAEVTGLDLQGASQRLSEVKELLQKARTLRELNPMLGHRGCRLGVTYPEIYEMQARAIFGAAARLTASGMTVRPDVMIPLVGDPDELELMRELVVRVAEETQEAEGVQFEYQVGTMIELPRACVMADRIAEHAEFFSFGTNDLTQTTFGFSRDDAEAKFLHAYLDKKIFRDNPFSVLDEDGVGELIQLAVERGKGARSDLKVGICGEHGGDPTSIAFCCETGLDYVSCSPFRVPIARLAAAQARLT